jgi:hypothetical protein
LVDRFDGDKLHGGSQHGFSDRFRRRGSRSSAPSNKVEHTGQASRVVAVRANVVCSSSSCSMALGGMMIGHDDIEPTSAQLHDRLDKGACGALLLVQALEVRIQSSAF